MGGLFLINVIVWIINRRFYEFFNYSGKKKKELFFYKIIS